MKKRSSSFLSSRSDISAESNGEIKDALDFWMHEQDQVSTLIKQ